MSTWWGGGGESRSGGLEVEEEEDLPDLRGQFHEQENLLGQLKGALKSNEAKLQNKEKQVKAIASRLSKSKLEERTREAAAKQTERQLVAESTGALPKALPSSAPRKGSKLSRLRQELQDAREKEAEMLAGQQNLEDKVAALQRELSERDNLIRDYDLASITGESSLMGSPYVMSPEQGASPSSGSPQMGSSFEDVFNITGKGAVITDFNEKILDYERRVMDLEEDLRNKDEVIRARTEAVSAVSEQMSHKGRSSLKELEDTKEEMRKLMLNFTESEMQWTKKNMGLQVDHDTLAQKLKLAQEKEARIEELRQDLSFKNESLQEKISRLQSELNAKRASDSKREIELLELRAELDTCKTALEAKETDAKNILDSFYDKIVTIFEENHDVDEALGATIKDLQSQVIDLEEEKGNLQLRLIDYEDETGINLKTEAQKLKESLRMKDEELVDLRTTVEEMKKEIQELKDELEKKEKEAFSYSDQVSELMQSNEEVSRSKVAAEMRALELEEAKESHELEKKDLSSKIKEMTQEYKEPFGKIKEELVTAQNNLSALENSHSECRNRGFQNDRELLEKAEIIKDHEIEIDSLEKVLQDKTARILDVLAKSEMIESELYATKTSLEEAMDKVDKKEEEILAFKSTNFQEQISTLENHILSLNLDLTTQQKTISTLESTANDKQSKLQNKEIDFLSLTEKYDTLCLENTELLQLKDELLNTKEELLQKLGELENDKSALSSGLDSNKLKYDSEVNDLNSKVQELNTEKESMSSRLLCLEEELNKFREEAEKEVGSLNETLNDKNKTIKALKEESESFKMDMEALNEKTTRSSSELEAKVLEIENLRSQISEQDAHISEIKLATNQNEAQQENLKGMNVNFEADINALHLKLKEEENEKQSLRDEMVTMKNEKKEMQDAYGILTSELSYLNSTLTQTQNEHAKITEELRLKSLATEKDEVMKTLESSIEDLRSYKDSIKLELGDKVSEIQGLKEIINELQTLMSDLKAEVCEKSSRIEELERDLSSSQEKREDSNRLSESEVSTRNELVSKIQNLETELIAKNSATQELSNQKIALEEELLALRQANTTTTKDSSDVEIAKLKASLDEKLKENSTLQDKVDSLGVKFNSLEGSYNSLLEGRTDGNILGERDKLKMKNDQLLDKARKLLIKCKQQEKTIKEKDEELKASREEFSKEKKELIEKWEVEKSEKEELNLNLNSLRDSNTDLESNYQATLSKIEELTAQNDSLLTQINETQQDEGWKDRITTAEKQVEELQAQNSQLKETVEDLSRIRDEFDREIKELRRSEGKSKQQQQQKDDSDLWDDGFPFEDSVTEEKVVPQAEKPEQPEEDGWVDEDWSAWGEEVVESTKLEKDSKEQEKTKDNTASNDIAVLIKEYELKILELNQNLEKEKCKLETERSKFSEEEEVFYDQIETLEKEIKTLQSSLQDAQMECRSYETKHSELQDQILNSGISSTEELIQKSDDVVQLMNENKEKSICIESLEDQLSCLFKNKETLETELQTLNDNLSSSLAEKEALGLNISNLEARILDMDKIESELEAKNKALIETSTQLEASSSNMQCLCAELESLRGNNNMIASEVETAKRNLSEASASEAKARLELECLQSSYDNLCSANMANESEKIQQLQVELERLRSDSISVQESHRNDILSLTTERDDLSRQVHEYNVRFEEQRTTEESLNQQISALNIDLRRLQEQETVFREELNQLKESSSQTSESLNSHITMLSLDLETKNNQILGYDAQISDFSATVESLRSENEGLGIRCSQLSMELESKSRESENLSLQLERAVSSQGESGEQQQSAFAPPPDVTQYQQQPDVALHSIPQPDIMPSGYVDLVQQPPEAYGQQVYDPSHSYPQPASWTNETARSFSQEVQTDLSKPEMDSSLQMQDSQAAQLMELQNEVFLLREANGNLQSNLSSELKTYEESYNTLKEELSKKESEIERLRFAEVVTPLDNNANKANVSEPDIHSLQQKQQQQQPSSSMTPDGNADSATIEWYSEQLNTYQTAINDWQEWGRLKTEELDGYTKAYNDVSLELNEARSAIEAKTLEIHGYSQNIETLSNEIYQLKTDNESRTSSNDDSWRAKIRSKEIEIQDLTETVERLQSEKEELVEEVNDLREKNETLRGERVSTEELEDLKYHLDELAEEKRLNSLEIESLKKKQENRAAKEDSLEKTKSRLQGDVDLANSVIKKLEAELKEGEYDFKRRESLAGETLLASQNAAYELQNEIDSLKSKINTYKEENSQLQDNLEKEKDEKSELTNEKLNEIDSCKSEMEVLKDELSTVKASFDTANTALAEWSSWGQTKMTEYDTLLKSYEEYVSAYNAINAELSALKENRESSTQSPESTPNDMPENSQLIDDLKSQLSAALEEAEKLKEEVQNVRLRNGKLTVRSKQMEKELGAVKQSGVVVSESCDVEEMRSANYELSKNVSSLQDELLESAKGMEEMNNERISLSQKVTNLENKIDQLCHDNELLRNVRSDYESLKLKYDILVSEKASDVHEVKAGDDSSSLIAQFEGELQRKNDLLTHLEDELSRLKVAGDNERMELDKSLRENRQLNSQMNYWKQQIYTEQQQTQGSSETSSPQGELHIARQAASAFQVQVEQLTTELTKLQEERDTLQLKLSNVMRQYERQRESSSRASTACSTPIPWMDSSLVEIKELRSKIEELGSLNYALDIELQKERQTREAMQARLCHQSSSSSSSTPVHLPQKSPPTSSGDLSSLSGGHVLHL